MDHSLPSLPRPIPPRHANPPARQRVAENRTLALASLGGALEFYDFVIFVFFTGVIAKLFFPPSLPDWVRELQSFGIFAAGYLARPLGGLVMAHFGDRSGRKRMFSLSVLLMAIPTLLIGLLPTWSHLGPAAPLLLLLMRVMQGAAIGGEAPGGWVFVAEHAAPHRVGFAIGLLTGGLTGGILLGSLAALVLSAAFTAPQILDFWWRVPFLLGGLFGFVAMVLRRWLQETPVFEAIRLQALAARELPLRIVLRRHSGAVLLSMAVTWMLTATVVVVILMTPTLLQKLFAVPRFTAQVANLVASAALTLSAIMTGAAVDRFGLRRVAVPLATLLVTATFALYSGLGRDTPLLMGLSLLAGLGAGSVSLTPILMVRAFPPPVRFSGLSLSYNVAYAIFGGVTPLLVGALAHRAALAPALYVLAACLIGLAAILRSHAEVTRS